MISVFVDCDVIIDLLTHREPHFYESAKLFQECQNGKVSLLTSPLAIANVHYIVRKSKGEEQTREILKKLLSLIKLTTIDEKIIAKALDSSMKDFEDAIQGFSAKPYKCKYIVTRNIKDYKQSEIEAITPTEMNKKL
ncbi:MAG: PIN domain-containing protein [Lentisphaeraceae bacterium]|nr:PIN domain-containing protein [Lentisphaeraceae bacterium]